MKQKIYESKGSKFGMLAMEIFVFCLGIAFLLAHSTFISIYFLFIAVVTIPYLIVRFKYKFPIIEYDDQQISILYKQQSLKLQWKDIQDSERKFGMPINGIVPSFIVIYLKDGKAEVRVGERSER